MSRCSWANSSEKMIRYHDEEWGVPEHDDRALFEYLFLEAMQCGLSWNLMIEKREIFRACFDDFQYEKIARYTEEDTERILTYPGMIRSPRKINAMIHNAQCYLRVIEEYGSFDAYLWSYSEGKTIIYEGHPQGQFCAKNGLSERISKDMKKRGFKYLGPVVIYSYLQACGIINDHHETCDCFGRICDEYPTIFLKPDNEG